MMEYHLPSHHHPHGFRREPDYPYYKEQESHPGYDSHCHYDDRQ